MALKKKLGFIVNPIAGMGGKVGLKGTDGQEVIEGAMELGATPVSPVRAVEALQRITRIKDDIKLITCPSEMGEEEVRRCGMNPIVIGSIMSGKTTATDTKNAARGMVELHVDLLLFAGGDGTARDIYEAVGQEIPVLGIPAGVKIHSGVFAVNPKKAGELAVKFLQDDASLREAEVMDIDEDAFRKGRVSAKLYGYLQVPYERSLVQQVKCGSPTILDEKGSQEVIAGYIVEKMDDDDYYYILAPGTTVKAIADRLGIKKTLLGVDLIKKKKIVAMDLNEEQLLKLIETKKVKIIVSPIGGQGFIFGRGNQQISPKVIRKVGRDNIIVVATKNKLSSMGLSPILLVDTGDDEVDKMLSGYMRVITGYNEEAVVKVAA
jgi:predicted polyphosphate/ATP-dependent NAD kinase